MTWMLHAINKIKTEQLSHRNWKFALSESISTLIASSSGEVLSITGPSRVGKTRLVKELSILLVGEKETIDDGLIPVVYVLATNSVKNNFFDSKDFVIRALEAIKHPFYGVNAANDPWGVERYRKLDKISEANLRRALETAIENRKTLYLVIDEVQHILRCYGGIAAASAFLNSLKSLAQQTNIILVLVGAYPILEALRLSPHMLGREHLVHFPRYSVKHDDLIVFNQILLFYSNYVHLPIGVGSLCDWNEYLFNGSLGCIGLLEKWLRTALANVIASGDTVLELKHLERTIKSDDKLYRIEEEILDGEKLLASSGKCINNLNNSEEKIIEVDKRKKITKNKRKPFQKKPRRYSVKGRE